MCVYLQIAVVKKSKKKSSIVRYRHNMAQPHPERTTNPLANRLINEEKEALQILQARVEAMRAQVQALEARVSELGTAAQTMPEDLGDWQEAPLRVQGLVTRIRQTHALALEVSALSIPPTGHDPSANAIMPPQMP